MILWRLSGVAHAHAFDGGYGLHFDGRWNTIGHAVTYASNSPSLCVLEKLVHIEDPALLPELVMVRYDVPDDIAVDIIQLSDLPDDWRRNEAATQGLGDAWHEGGASPLLRVPSAIVPIAGCPDVNYLVNHRHPDAQRIRIANAAPFVLDTRLI